MEYRFLDNVCHRDNRILSFLGHFSYMNLAQVGVNLFVTLQLLHEDNRPQMLVEYYIQETAWRALPNFVHSRVRLVTESVFEPVVPASPRVLYEHQYAAFRDMLHIEENSLCSRIWQPLQSNANIFIQRDAPERDSQFCSVFVHQPGYVRPDGMIYGGILGNDRGTGKTFVTACLIRAHSAPPDFQFGSALPLSNSDLAEDESDDDEDIMYDLGASENKTAVPTTLIVVPAANLLAQWVEELEMLDLRVFIHHGRTRVNTIQDLLACDVVLTTTDTLRLAMTPTSVFQQVHFWRLVCDEGHRLLQGNGLNRAGLAACMLSARNRWILTATPDMNSSRLRQYALIITGQPRNMPLTRNSLLHYFMRYPGRFTDQAHVPLIKSILVQHEAVHNLLPVVNHHVYTVPMEDNLQPTYQQVIERARRPYQQSGIYAMRVFNNLLATLNGVGPMRWPSAEEMLATNVVELPQDVYDCSVCLDALRQPMRSACHHYFCQECIQRWLQNSAGCPLCRRNPLPLLRCADVVAAETDEEHSMAPSSAKMAFLIGHIESLLQLPHSNGEPHRILVFSRYLPVRKLLLQTLGPMATAEISEFQNGQASVLVLSFLQGSVGLNLMRANHVVLSEPCFRKSTETQAIGRAARLGQTRPVHVHQVMMQHTIEEAMYHLPRENRLSIQNAFSHGF